MSFSKVRITSILSALLLFLMISSEVRSQGWTSPFSWNNYIFDARVAALGQSTATLKNPSAYHINPAVPFNNGTITASSYLLSTTPFIYEYYPGGSSLYSPAIGYSSGNFSYAVMLDQTSYSYYSPFTTDLIQIMHNSSLLRFQLGYQISERFYAGAGLVYSSVSLSINPEVSVGGNNQIDANAWGLTFGAYYQDQIETSLFRFRPQVGLSLNDLSTGFEFEGSTIREHLPGQIRLGIGMDISSRQERYNLPMFGIGLYTGFSKYLSRWEYDPETGETLSPSGFEALFTTWNSITKFDGLNTFEITLGEQISASLGIEVNLLETLYLRYGLIGGADRWVRPQHGLGFEVDFYYVAIAVTNMSYHSSEDWLPQDDITTVQATVRIPIDGKPRNSLVSQLFR